MAEKEPKLLQGIERNHSEEVEEQLVVGDSFAAYLTNVLSDPENLALQQNLFTDQAWGNALSQFTNHLPQRLAKVTSLDDLGKLTVPLVTRGIELVSGGVISHQDVPEGSYRGIKLNGTWPHTLDGGFWDPRQEKHREEEKKIREIVHDVLRLQVKASEAHIGRVITMSLPAILAFGDLTDSLTPKEAIVETVRRMLESERSGTFNVKTFGCEPYEYEHAPQTTASYMRRSAFGSEDTLQRDFIHGSFRGVRRILEPLSLSGVRAFYEFYTSFGSDGRLIQRQVMPDTINYYRQYESSDAMLGKLRNWRKVTEEIGNEEFEGSNIDLEMKEMEQEVVLPALQALGEVLRECGMEMPDDMNEFYYNSEEWFAMHAHQLHLFSLLKHPNPSLLTRFLKNEDEWSRKHADSYANEEARMIQAALLSFFELHQYERINHLINESDLALGVEIDEALLMTIRAEQKNNTPLVWGRQAKFNTQAQLTGVGHRQPWIYAANEY